jgi:flagellar biosynthesis protein FlhB
LLPATIPVIIIEELQSKLSHLVKILSDKHTEGKFFHLSGEILLLCLVCGMLSPTFSVQTILRTASVEPNVQNLHPQIMSVSVLQSAKEVSEVGIAVSRTVRVNRRE